MVTRWARPKDNTPLHLRSQSSSLGPIVSPKVRSVKDVLDPKILGSKPSYVNPLLDDEVR